MGMRLKRRSVAGYTCVLLIIVLIHGWRQSLDEDFVEIHLCPSCYGQSHCDVLLNSGETRDGIKLTSYSQWKLMRYVNVKNVYYAFYGENQVVLKKLAHDSELKELDEKFCLASKRHPDCNVSQAVKTIVALAGHDIVQILKRNKELFEESDAVRCHHNQNVMKLYENFIQIDFGPYHMHHFLTMLAVNMEPLVLMAHHQQWFPRLIGTCGRIIIEEFVGPTLSELGGKPWLTRADYARQLLEMAEQFSDGEIRFYMTDVSLDNFAVDASGNVKMIDAENLVLVDSTYGDLDSTEHVNDGFGCKDCLSFSFEDLCGHKYSDHNYFAVCKGILSATSFSEDIPNGLLHSPPDWIIAEYPTLLSMVEECAAHPQDPHKYAKPRRKEAANALHSLLSSVLKSQ